MIDENQTVLLELIKCSLFGSVPCLPVDTKWDEVLQEAQAQTVVAIAASAVPKELSAPWAEPVAKNTAHFMRVLFEQKKLTELFTKSGIPFVILKGCAAAVYYPRPECRTMGDVDFLVSEDKFETSRLLLEENGYRFERDFGDGRDYIYTKGGVVLELHQRYSDADFNIEPVLTGKLSNPVVREIKGIEFPSLPDCENGLVLLDHIRHHLKGGLGIRQIIDWMMFVHAVLDDETFNNAFLTLTESAGLTTFCRIVTKMCKMHFGLPDSITWCDSADGKTADELYENVFKSGNFGRKNPYVYKPMESLTIGIKKNGLFKTLQRAGVENFSICKRNRFFRAFAWLFQIFRYL